MSHLLINHAYRIASPGLYVEGYGETEFIRDLKRVGNLMRNEAELVFESHGVVVYRLPEADCD